MKRKGCSVLLTLAMLLGLLPTTALAAQAVDLTQKVLDSTYSYNDCYWLNANNTTYKLTENITIDKPICIGVSDSYSKITVTFDLNGYTLEMTEKSGAEYKATNNALNIGHYRLTEGGIANGYADVTIKGGTIEGGYYGVKVSPYADCTMESGTITGAKNAGVFTDDNASDSSAIKLGEFIMKGGEISGNPIGIVCCGKLTLDGGTITANDSYGVHLTTYHADSSDNTLFGIFTMKSGEISENGDHGVYMIVSKPRSVQFTMEGGTISGNEGYGVYMGMTDDSKLSKFTMKNGKISGNKGGVYYGNSCVDGATFAVGGTAYIWDNKEENGNQLNVDMKNKASSGRNERYIDRVSALLNGACIGVTSEVQLQDMDDSVRIMSYNEDMRAYKQYFQSDDPLYEIYVSDSDYNNIYLKLKEHTWSDWEKSDDIYHKRKCTDVGCSATEQEAHTGGTADCVTQATCEKCGEAYGDFNATKHNKSIDDTQWQGDANSHWHEYPCCHAKADETNHSGGTANCEQTAECSICGKTYGGFGSDNHTKDLDLTWKSDGNSHWREYPCCHAKADEAPHSGGTANCKERAVCNTCGTAYGDLNPDKHADSGSDPNKWESDQNNHWHIWECCKKVDEDTRAAHVYDNDSDATCNTCGYTRKIDSGNTPGGGTSSGGSSGGGSSSVDSSYKVSRDETSNGTIESSRTGAKRGETVILTPTPDEGYALESLRVLDSNGNEIALEKLDDGSYRFVMPSGDVDVSASYVKIADAAPVSQEKTLIFTIGSSTVLENGRAVSHDAAPKIRGNRTVLPVRAVAEALGADVAWDDAQRKITVTKGDAILEIFIGKAFALVNGEQIAIDAPAFIENDRAYLPLRFIAEQLGADVAWDHAAQQVVIRYFG